MSNRKIIAAFDEWRAAGRDLVMATVCDTLGSTYSKAGHRIVIDAQGQFQGLVSGGCLEGDLAERAARVIGTGSAELVTYDMRDPEDDLWGLGVGCNGLMRVLLQPLTQANAYEPFATLRDLQFARRPATVVTVYQPCGSTPAGTTILCERSDSLRVIGDAGIEPAIRDFCAALGRDPTPPVGAELADRLFVSATEPIRRLLILGAGLDAVPVARMARELGWYVALTDHRPAYLARGDLDFADRAALVDPRNLPQDLAPAGFDAILVMSHHLLTDAAYLASVAQHPCDYLGVIGPVARRARLLDMLEADGVQLGAPLRGPVGLDLGAQTPEGIALSIVAEIQAVFAGRQPA